MRAAPDALGYASPEYAAAVAGEGEVLVLPRSGAHLVRRHIPGTDLSDAVAPYPFLACVNWAALAADLADLPSDVVSVTAVVDPLGEWIDAELASAFPDLLRPFKKHVVVPLNGAAPPSTLASAHHRRNIRRALRSVSVRESSLGPEDLDAWISMYRDLIERTGAGGSAADFTPEGLRQQWGVPGLRVFVAEADQGPVSVALWMRVGDTAAYHLGASTDAGYAVGAAFAVFAHSMDRLQADGCRVVLLGGGPGIDSGESTGVFRFKAGWSDMTMYGRLGGRVLDPVIYRALAGGRGGANTNYYFPAYRLLA